MTVSDRDSISVKEQDERLPYRLREHFLSTPELALLRMLQRMVGSHYLICPKVALNDIFYVARPNENVHFFNKFFRKHVDFLLCEPDTLKPAFGIELVKPVTRNETREADQFMGELFLSARLPMTKGRNSASTLLTSLPRSFAAALPDLRRVLVNDGLPVHHVPLQASGVLSSTYRAITSCWISAGPSSNQNPRASR